MKKQLISTAIAFIMVVNLVLVPDGAAVFTAGAATSGDWTYSDNGNNTVTINKYNGTTPVVTIPSSLDGKKVTSIKSTSILTSVFGTTLVSATIPNGVTSIDARVFYGCSSLTAVTIPSSVASIGESAFRDCSSLTAVTIPSSVQSIGENAFRDCSSLTSLNIPSSVKSIGENAFWDCSSLTSLNIPSSVTSIGENAFRGCSGIVSLTIKSGVASIGESAFMGCSSLITLTIPGSVQNISDYAFYKCSSLTSVIIENGVVRIGKYAFSAHDRELYSWETATTSLVAVVIPKSVSFIGSGAFYNSDKVSIYGIEGSYANTYAKENNIPFVKTDSTHKFSVSFNLNYSGATGTPATQKISPGLTVKKPTDPKRSGYIFAGWYTNKNGTTSWDFSNDTVKGATTLYAKWEKAPTAPKSVKATSTGTKKIKVSWNKVSGASGYEVWRATSKNGTYTKKKTINSGSTTSYTNSGLTTGKTYYYKVRAYKLVDGKKVYGSYSSVKSAKPVPDKVKSLTSATKTKTTVTLSWKKVDNASGYEVYRATSKNGTYKKVKTIKKGSTVKYKNSSLTSGKKYYYKVRAYRTVDGKKVYGSYSSVKSVTTKK